MTWRRLLVLAGFIALGLPAFAGEGVLVLNTGTLAPFTRKSGDGFLDLVVREAFSRLGREARVAVYERASERAIRNAAEGIDDGIALRIKGLDEKYPHLLFVPEKVMDNDFVAIAARPDIEVRGFSDLRPFSVGYILGWQVFDRHLGEGGNATQVKSADQLFDLLERGRVDVVLYERWQGLQQARDRGIPARIQEPPLVRQEMFMYLHEKHRALVAPLAGALRAMKADGSYAAIAAETLIPLAGR